MTDAEISLVIAEFLEPKTGLAHPRSYISKAGHDKLSSPEECWTMHFSPISGYKWQPRDMVNDPAMRDMLQEKLLRDGWTITLLASGDGAICGNFSPNSPEPSFMICTKRELLWAEAFIRANQLGGK